MPPARRRSSPAKGPQKVSESPETPQEGQKDTQVPTGALTVSQVLSGRYRFTRER